MSDTDLDFDPDELAMLRGLFRSEAHDALEAVTARILAGGSAKPSAETINEMMRVTHTLKGAAGTVGLDVMVELTHRLESSFAALGREPSPWLPTTADLIVEVTDGLRGYLDELASDPASADKLVVRLREQIERIASVPLRGVSRESASDLIAGLPPGFIARDSANDLLAPSANDSMSMPTMTISSGLEEPPEVVLEPQPDAGGVVEPKSYLRVEPERVDALMSSGASCCSTARVSSVASSCCGPWRATSRVRASRSATRSPAKRRARPRSAPPRPSSRTTPPCCPRRRLRSSTKSKHSAAPSENCNAASCASAWRAHATS